MNSTRVSPSFPPKPEFQINAHIKSSEIWNAFRETAQLQPDGFWRELSKALVWKKPFDKVLDWKMPNAKWFSGGKINVAENCLDRHLNSRGDQAALIWEGEPIKDGHTETRTLSYRELHKLSCQIANAIAELGVAKGDRVAIYMPMVPETVASMLACARLGAIHTVIFGGFSSQSIVDRIKDSGAKMIITSDGTYRKGNWLSLKKIVDDALEKDPSQVKKVLVFNRDANQTTPMQAERDVAWSFVLKQKASCDPVALDSEDPLFILYTSGTTGKPKGLFHTQAGYLLWAHWSTRWLFDMKPGEDRFWCTADCGWITGHTYVTYGPLSNGGTVFIYEGAPMTPTPSRYWEMIDRHKLTVLYTAPTAIRSFMRFGEEPLKNSSLKSLRLLGSVGEPINPEAWLWYNEHIGHNTTPIVDTWWQTETGGAMIAPCPGAVATKPGSCTIPLPGIDADVVDPETGVSVGKNKKGVLVIRNPWPSMARGIWNDTASPDFDGLTRYEKSYWNTKPALKGIYVTADLAEIDDDGYVWVEGRMDDVLNVSGHRLGSAEIESAVVSHHAMSEAAAVGIPDKIKGQGIAVFVTPSDHTKAGLENGTIDLAQLKIEIREHVGREIGALAKPDQIRIAWALPKTRSGKIMRRLLRELATTGHMTGDTSTLEDFSAHAAMAKDED